MRQRGFKRVSRVTRAARIVAATALLVASSRLRRRRRPVPRRGHPTAGSHDGGPGPVERTRPGRVVDGHQSTLPTTVRRSRASSRSRGGVQGRTRFGTVVDVPTQSDKTYRLYAQPPNFGTELEISLVDGPSTIATAVASYAVQQPGQMIVGVVTEHPGASSAISTSLEHERPQTDGDRPRAGRPAQSGRGVGALDRLIWQDVDSSSLDTEQLAALRGWLAGERATGHRRRSPGRRASPRSRMTSSPTDRPRSRTRHRRRRPARRDPGSRDRPAGPVRRAQRGAGAGDDRNPGRRRGTLVRHGRGDDRRIRPDRRVADRHADGRGPLAPARPGAGTGHGVERRRQPDRPGSHAAPVPRAAADRGPCRDARRLHPLIGPINYLVLRHFDKREWAWVTMPALIVAFSVGAYGFGSFLRGSDIVVNEVAIVRGRRERPRASPRPTTAASSRRPGARTTCGSRAARSSRHLSAATSEPGNPGRPVWMCSRAIRRGCAISVSGSAPCGRSAPRARWPSPLLRTDLRLEDGRIEAPSPTIRRRRSRSGRRGRQQRRPPR